MTKTKATKQWLLVVFALAIFVASVPAWAVRLADYKPYEYDIRFTNPVCAAYSYPNPVQSQSGTLLRHKPVGAFCTARDSKASAERPNSPMSKLREWIRDPATKEIFFAFLSFSNQEVMRELCDAVEKRDVKLTFVLDSQTESKLGEELATCRPLSGRAERSPMMLLRGHKDGMGFAHNKVVIAYPGDGRAVRIAFGSGNLSSGIVLHHENWHFIKTNPRSHFAQAHECLRRAMIESGDSKRAYQASVASCRKAIREPEEEDIRTFFVPGEGPRAFELIRSELAASSTVWLAAHRFSFPELMRSLEGRLKAGPSVDMRLVVDDDVWWVGHGVKTGANERSEYNNVARLEQSGLRPRYVETNHWLRLFHHNKFIIFGGGRRSAVFTGAGNFTKAAFTENMENFYFIAVPEVVEAFRRQYEHLWNRLATDPGLLPKNNVKPL